MDFEDQMHTFVIEVPRVFFATSRGITLTMEWTLVGAVDEFVGIDNVYSVACVDTVPSASPSESPSTSPTNPPTDPPRVVQVGPTTPSCLEEAETGCESDSDCCSGSCFDNEGEGDRFCVSNE